MSEENNEASVVTEGQAVTVLKTITIHINASKLRAMLADEPDAEVYDEPICITAEYETDSNFRAKSAFFMAYMNPEVRDVK